MAEVDNFGLERFDPTNRVDGRNLQVVVGFDVRSAGDLRSELLGVPDKLGTDDNAPTATLDDD